MRMVFLMMTLEEWKWKSLINNVVIFLDGVGNQKYRNNNNKVRNHQHMIIYHKIRVIMKLLIILVQHLKLLILLLHINP